MCVEAVHTCVVVCDDVGQVALEHDNRGREHARIQFPNIVNTEALRKGDAVFRYLPKKVAPADEMKAADRKLSHASSTAAGPTLAKKRKQ